ncbi:MAG: polysaccharide deacetylase family protein [Hyphomicrobiales bacterium]|nr:MAG: polysaccharide deacetylase family protein [Hyphomicrobiales bacterium]
MIPLRSTLRHAARSLRRWLGTPHPVILMYHRVARLEHDPWELAVSPENLDGQLAMLKRERDIVPLGWLVARLRAGKPTYRMAVITFDDGYVDVLDEAVPLLQRHGCPATVFLPSAFLGRPDGFWWDALTRVFYATAELPRELEIELGGTIRRFSVLPQHEDEGRSRRRAHEEVWGLLLPLEQSRRDDMLGHVLDWAGLDRRVPRNERCITPDEAVQLSVPGLIDIGAHTMTHPSLPALAAAEQLREIRGSIVALRDLLGAAPTGLAYPFGHHDVATIATAAEAGLSYACTTQGRAVTGNDLLRLPRLQVPDVSAAEFARRVLAYG